MRNWVNYRNGSLNCDLRIKMGKVGEGTSADSDGSLLLMNPVATPMLSRSLLALYFTRIAQIATRVASCLGEDAME